MRESFYVTTSIAYVNDRPHIGHAYESVAADTIARFRRGQGEHVHFLTGTDEHGIRLQRIAEAQRVTPQAWVDEIARAHRALADRLQISYTDFIRTSEERHRQAVQRIFTRLNEQGDIYLATYEGWYCQHEESFWTASQVAPGNLCPECGRPLEWARESSYYFRLSKYADQIKALLQQPGFLVPESRRNEALAFVNQGLTDLAVSRTSVQWGVPVPFDPAHTIYVWVDALSNYITALGYGSDDDTLYRTYWPANLHLVGKDITRFHVIIWPALLLALGEPTPKQVWGHGWFNMNGAKISKSRGNAVDPHQLIDRYGVDAVRYYLLRTLPFGPDADYSEDGLIRRYNEDLANDLGNLLSRTTKMIETFAGGLVPASAGGDGVLESAALEAVAAVAQALNDLRLADGLVAIFDLIAAANRYVDGAAPWSLARDPAEQERLADVLYSLAETLRVAAVALTPFLVETPEQIYRQLGLDPLAVRATPWHEATRWGGLPPGTRIQRGEPLFPRIVTTR